jgi:hypothetical protein
MGIGADLSPLSSLRALHEARRSDSRAARPSRPSSASASTIAFAHVSTADHLNRGGLTAFAGPDAVVLAENLGPGR